MSNNNSADYAPTAANATVTNNAGQAYLVPEPAVGMSVLVGAGLLISRRPRRAR
jgi:hypothetical protein